MLVFKRREKLQVGTEVLATNQTYDINLGETTIFNYRGALPLQKQYPEAS